jgi:hypothetical protein
LLHTHTKDQETQTTGHYHCSSSEPEEFEVDTNKDDETDADWTPSAEKCADNASPEQMLDACLKNVRILDMLHPANINAPAIIKLPNGIVPENG